MRVDEVKLFVKEHHKQPGLFFNPSRFDSDFSNLITTRKMVTRFLKTGKVNDKLVVNNIICSLNAFGPDTARQAFRLLCNDQQFGVVKSVFMFLRYWKEPAGSDVETNRVMDDILSDVRSRYRIRE